MKKFKVVVRGENFLMNVDSVEKRMGFYTTRFVEAENEEAAEYAVMDILRDDLEPLNDKSDSPMMYAEKVEELDSFAGFPVPGAGFTFYHEKKEGECGNS
jgi:hypothetical protein